MNRNITISGGGLSGLSLAIGLRRADVEVHLHEAGTYPRHRVCGEFISGVSPGTLKQIGIADCLDDAQRHHSYCWFSGDQQLRQGTLKDPALAISRYTLDRRLYDKACELGAEVTTSSRINDRPDTPGFVRTAGRIPARGPWIGLKAHIRGLDPTAELEMHIGPHGYLGVTAVEDGWFNVCGLFRIDRSLNSRHESLLPDYLERNGNRALAEQLRRANWRKDSFTAVAGFQLGRQPARPGILALGDSHAIIPPFTGNGMSMAFQSVELALPHLVDYAHGNIDWSIAQQRIEYAHRRHFRKRLTASRLLHPLLFHPATQPLLKHLPLGPVLQLIR